ncbi:MAG TPA: translocation/assembly module TamB domain-containing protein [Vicinamibacteria bacterium]|nr:translocation/assembly module TamB domain-containing protein [Vicinamibacteria bacterium]
MTRPRRRFLLALALTGLAGAALLRLPVWSSEVVAARLTSFFGRPVSVGRVEYRFFPLEIEVRDVRVAGAAARAPAFLEVRALVAAPRLRPLWRRRTELRSLSVRGAVVRVNAWREGGDDIPLFAPGEAGRDGVRIARLVIRESLVEVNHERVPLDLELPDFNGRLEGSGGDLRGHVSFGPGAVRFGDNAPLPFSVVADLGLRGTRVTVETGRIEAVGTQLTYRGILDLAPLRGRFEVHGPIDLAVLEEHVVHTGFDLRGRARYDGSATLEGSRLRLSGEVEGAAGSFDGIPVPRYAGRVAWDRDGVHVSGLEVVALGGSARVDVEVPPAPGRPTLAADLRAVDAEPLVRWIFDLGAAGLGASATGKVSLSWPRGRVRALSGEVALDLAEKGGARTPLSGRVEWRAEDGTQFLDAAELRTAHTQARLSGRIEKDLRTALALQAQSRDLAATDELLLRLRRALGASEAHAADLGGAGEFEGRWGGTLSAPVFEGRFTGDGLSYLGVVWGRAEWRGALTPSELRSQSLVVRRPGGELALEGTMQTGPFGQEDALDVRLRFSAWPSADFVRALEWDVDVEGLVSGRAAVRGRRSDPRGETEVTSPSGRYYGVPFTDLSLDTALHGALTEVRTGRARVGGGVLSFHGTLTDDGIYDGEAGISEVDLAEVLPAAGQARWGGRVSGQVVLQGTLSRPRVQARFTSPRLFLGDEGVGALAATFHGDGDGHVAVDARCRSARVDLALFGRVAAAAPYAAALRLQARDTSVDPFLRAALGELIAPVEIVAGGEATITGALQRPRQLAAEASVTLLRLGLPDYPVRNEGEVSLAVRDGELEVRRAHLAGEGTDLVVTGRAALFDPQGPLALSVAGSADLRAVSLVAPELRGRGGARLTLRVAGTRSQPDLDGALEILGASIRTRGFPHGIEELRGTVRFTEGLAHFTGVSGTLGGGPVDLTGQAAYAGGRLVSFDVHGTGRGVSLRYPEGLRSVVDADLRLFGDFTRQWLTGKLDVRHASWTQRYDVASELLAEGRAAEEVASFGEGLRYDVKVSAPGTLKVDNNLAALLARAELTLQGTYAAPVVLGRAEVDRGRVYFQGNTYVIRRGNLDFANPRKTDPLFDIEAETRIRSYRVTLKMNGTLDRVYPTLTSDPPLSTVAILGLLAGADEAKLADLETRRDDDAQRNLAATGAATLAAGVLSEEMGLERGAARLGLDRFSIDPSIIRGNVTNPTARLTLGKRITPDVSILYSVDLRGTEERLVSIEYTLSDRLSLLMTSVQPGGFGFDLRLRQSR